jgi:hypothetical protein
MRCHEDNVDTNETEVSQYKFQIPLTPVHGIVIAESQRTVLAPTYSAAPGATPGGWTQTIGLAHDFLVGQYGKAVLR